MTTSVVVIGYSQKDISSDAKGFYLDGAKSEIRLHWRPRARSAGALRVCAQHRGQDVAVKFVTVMAGCHDVVCFKVVHT